MIVTVANEPSMQTVLRDTLLPRLITTIVAIGSRVRTHLKRTGGTPPARKRRTHLEMAAAAIAKAEAEALKDLYVYY
jgi:hypothetical protein